MNNERLIVKEIARIEGHLDVALYISENEIRQVRAEAVEGTRILERVLIGKSYMEVPEITSRMCGVCSVIHKVTAVQAIENALGIELPSELKNIRELTVIGGHIQSHILHLFFFVLPDLLRKTNIFDIAKQNVDLVKRVIELKRLANKIIEILGGSRVHPIAPIPGGVSKQIRRSELSKVLDIISNMKKVAPDIVRVFLEIELPSFSKQNIYVALHDGKSVPLLEGNIMISNDGIYKPEEYPKLLIATRESYSVAPHYVLAKSQQDYMVGALSRLNHNHDYLSLSAKELCKEYNLKFPMHTPFANNTAQAVEIMHFIDKAEEIINNLLENPPRENIVKFDIKEGDGIAVTEAPRGLLIHHYRINSVGKVIWANIVTPTAQNLKSIEANAKAYGEEVLKKGYDIKLEIEKLVRAYDPCLSCAARFYKES